MCVRQIPNNSDICCESVAFTLKHPGKIAFGLSSLNGVSFVRNEEC